jgi:hypothetical protein
MATRSTIAVKQDDGSVKAIYCHYDGYPTGVGVMLTRFYGSAYEANQMIAMGNMSTIGASIGDKVDFNTFQDFGKQCVFYGRDRKESDQEARVYGSVAEWVASIGEACENYGYIFQDGKWIAYERDYSFGVQGVRKIGAMSIKVEFEKVA